MKSRRLTRALALLAGATFAVGPLQAQSLISLDADITVLEGAVVELQAGR